MEPIEHTAEGPFPGGPPTRPWWLARLAAAIEYGALTVSWPGATGLRCEGARPGPHADLRLHRPLAFLRRLARRGLLGLGESYVAGDWDSADLEGFLYWGICNHQAFATLLSRSWLGALLAGLHHRARPNSHRGARRNIAAHYDLGNAFYRLWLDETQTYSAAWFAGATEVGFDGLAAAQRAKNARLLEALGLAAGAEVLEIGCGWGGMLEQAAQAGFDITGITLSTEQLAFANDRLARAGLAGRARARLVDYRQQSGEFDGVVSVEMFEAVGEPYWPQFFSVLRSRLKPGARAALQVITLDEAHFEAYRAEPDFIQLHVFPGGMLPSVPRFEASARAAGLEVVARTGFGADYAQTLSLWLQRFDAQREAVRGLGFDDRFIRLWRYYLAYCAAGFNEGRLDVQHWVLRRPEGRG